jgi:CRP-like cAMP-binding protein
MGATGWIPAAVRGAGKEKSLSAGETLFRAGARSLGFYEVLTGRVRLARTDASGRESILYTATPGEALAEASLFSATYHCDAVATTDATVRLYPKAALLAAFEDDPEALRAFSAMLARQVMGLRTQLERNTMRSAADRLRHYLSLNVGADGHTVPLAGSLKELAANLGLTHEALYRALAKLAKAGEIKRGKGFVNLTSRFRL